MPFFLNSRTPSSVEPRVFSAIFAARLTLGRFKSTMLPIKENVPPRDDRARISSPDAIPAENQSPPEGEPAGIRNTLIARNAFRMLVGQGIRALLQGCYFILLARALGPEKYGAFVGVTAFVFILAPFASMGTGNLLIQNVSRNPLDFPQHWGKAISMTLLTSAVLLLVALALRSMVLPDSVPARLIIAVAIADLCFARLADVGAQSYQAFQRLGRTSQCMVFLNVCRLLGVIGFSFAAPEHTIEQWGMWYLASTVPSGILVVWLVCHELGWPTLIGVRISSQLKQGFYYSLTHSAAGISNDIDKTMLVRLSTLESAGIYGAAYRLIDVSFTPVRSLLFATYAKFFQHGQYGITGSLIFAKRFVPMVGAYGIFAGLSLFFAAPVVPVVLGADFENSVSAIRWLSLLPLLKALQYFAGDTLTGAGLQGTRCAIQGLVAGFNVLINIWLIPAYSWRGAAWASLASDGLLMIILWAMVLELARRSSISQA